ncbi:hypothetical protein G4228_013182 [Cervus hanglu yarkandensis]|nr:hypothetical protein G4228_013182 [Cervus hanglu yarkandensis]
MRLALLWALGLLGAGSPLPSRPLPDIGVTKETQARPERVQKGPLEPRILRDNLTLSQAAVLQTSLPEALRIKLELDGESHILELLQNRGLVILSPERSYSVELGPGDLQGPPVISRIQDLLLPRHTCALSWPASVLTQALPEHPLGQRHTHRWRRDVVTETKIVELVIVADHSEVQRHRDFQSLLNRTLEVALLLDTFFRPMNVRVALVGLEAWTQHDLIEISQNPGLTLDSFLHWRRTNLLPRLPHDSAQLVTATSFSGPTVGMAIQNSICSPEFSGGVNMDCTDPCCDYFTCQLRPGAQCASDGLCCHNCQLRPAGWKCRPTRGECDLPEFCPGDSSQCPPDVSMGDGEPCAGGQAVCMLGRCASYAQQCQALWGPGAKPAAPLCLLTANTRGDAFGSCGRNPDGSYVSCASRDAMCGQLQCQGGRAQPLLGSARDLRWEMLEANGTQLKLNCSWVHLDLGNDVAQPLLTLPGTACGPGLVCDSNRRCHCEDGWAPPDCATHIRATSSLTTGLPLSLLLLLVLVLLGASYWHRARLRQRLCQLKGPSCQYRAAQSGPPERPGPPQRALLMPGAKSQGPTKPPPPRKPLPADPHGRRPSAPLTFFLGFPHPRPAPPPPAASSLYL